MSCTSETDHFEEIFSTTEDQEGITLEERVEEYRLKRLSKEFTLFGGVRDV